MNPIYQKLFDTYAVRMLDDVEAYDTDGIRALLDAYPLETLARIRLEDAFYDRYLQWSADGYALGLHLALSLLRDDVRRPGPQQVQ